MNRVIEATIKSLVADFLYYDRKEDEELKNGDIETEIDKGNLTVDDIVEMFKQELERNL